MIDEDIQIPGYDLTEHVAQGGMSSVFRARQHIFDRDVALKIMRQDLAEDSHFNERFVQESLIVAKLHHSHIVQVYDVGEVSDHCFIAMEFLSGGALKAKMANGLSIKMSVSILKQIASALDFAHQKGIVHRDIKPDNIMFREDGAAVLTDFGIAKDSSVDMELTQAGAIMGTPKYMAPEQIKGEDIVPATDLYSLGVVFFEMLTGFSPFPGKDFVSIAHKHLNEPVPRLPEHLAHFQIVVDRLLAKNPAERFARAGEIYMALDKIAERNPHSTEVDETVVVTQESLDFGSLVSSGQSTQMRTGLQKTKDLARKPQTIGIAASIAVVALVLVVWQVVQTPDDDPTAVYTTATNGQTPTELALTPQQLDQQRQLDERARQQRLLDERNNQVQLLLVSAKTDILNDRLTRPENNNALDKFRQVIELDPSNSEAQAGITDIARRYVQLANTQLRNKNTDSATTYLRQAQAINAQLPEVQKLATEIQVMVNADQAAQKAIVSQFDQLRIDGLLDMAQREEKEGRTSRAIEHYKQILSIDSTHQVASRKLRELQ